MLIFIQDETTLLPTRFAIHVKKTIKQLEAQEDTDENCQITVEDGGPKVR
jgi:alpha,alpha-trehalase